MEGSYEAGTIRESEGTAMENQNTETYLSILINSLSSKNMLLNELLELTLQQESIINEREPDYERFNSVIDKKAELIKKIQEIDDGFELVFNRVREVLTKDKQRYEDKVKLMQQLIRDIMDKGVRLEVLEKQNKMKMEIYFSNKRNEIRTSKINNRTVANYYKSMSRQHAEESYFFDTKK